MESRQYTFNNSKLTVRFGNILDTNAEVIVSSVDSYVTMGCGVALAILRAGGDTIIKDAQKMCPVPLGDVIATTAGNLKKQKYIYHCVTIDNKRAMQMIASHVTEEDVLNYLLQHAVNKCFQLLQAMEFTSIAFPALGAGAACIPIKKVIEQMSIAIARNLANTNKSLNVEIFLYDIYHIYSESDYITLFESLAAKAALVEYKKKVANEDSTTNLPVINKNVVLPTRNTMKHQVFISYSRKDKNMADALCEILKENGIKYWIDKEGVYSSFNYKELIVDAIEVSQAVIFISSVNSNASINVIREIGYAVNRNKPVLPLMLDDAPYAKSIRLDMSDIDQINFRHPMASSKKLITSLMYVVNK